MFKFLKGKKMPEQIPGAAAPVAPTPAPLAPQAPFELKIKACSLAAEARIIRAAELRLKRRQAKARSARREDLMQSIHNHRKHEVAVEARATQLARTFLKGQAYCIAENWTQSYPPLVKSFQMVQKYGVGDKRVLAQKFEEWKQAANAHAEKCMTPPVSKADEKQ